MFCPHCQRKLSKGKDSGEGVKCCAKCGASWFILECRHGKEVEPLCVRLQGLLDTLQRKIGYPWFDLACKD